jgi:RimJ/RimL family protein N-acetyltransferase
MTAPRELRTARLLLRCFQREDIPTLVPLVGAREIAATTANIPHPYTEDDGRSFLTQSENDFLAGRSIFYLIAVAQTGELCGGVGLSIKPAHSHAELGYWIGVPYWGQGLATEAASAVVAFGFESLGLHRIYANVHAGNIASQRVLEKIGMRHEGRSREHVRKWDRFVDLENYGVLAGEIRGGKSSA